MKKKSRIFPKLEILVKYGISLLSYIHIYLPNICNARFGEDSVNKMIDWVLDNIDDKTTAILDLGCGNGHLLLELDSFGYSNLCGMDYSEKAIELARNVANSRSQSSIQYICWDLFASPPEKPSESKYGLIMDKGTLDAIALSPNNKQHVEENGVTLVKSYVEKVTNLLSDDGVLLITSCNFTRPELLDIFDKSNSV